VQHHGTQRDAAAALGVSQATFSRWLDGSRSPKRASRQRLIALGADPRTL
jgi:transcriptional regulator with XRE-family HTH domain